MGSIYPELERIPFYLADLKMIQFKFKNIISYDGIDLNLAGKTCNYNTQIESLNGTNATKGLVNYVVLDEDLQLQKFNNTDFDPDTLAIYDHAQP